MISKINKIELHKILLPLNYKNTVNALAYFVRDELADILKQPKETVDISSTFASVCSQLHLSEEEIGGIRYRLFNRIQESLGIHFYPFEYYLYSVSKLAIRLSDQYYEIWKPEAPKPIKDFDSEPNNWPWSTSKKILEHKVKKQAVFLLSCPRSGSTISRLILAGSSELFSPSELHLLPFESMRERENQIVKLGFEWMRAGIIEAYMDIMKISGEEAHKYYMTLVEKDVSTESVYMDLIAKSQNRIIVDKTPFYACHPAWLARAEQIFENPKYIFLSRHPQGMINSFVKMRLKNLTQNKLGPVDENPWRLGEKWWTTGNQNIKNFLSGIPSDRQYFTRYEDIVSNPEKITSQICEFLGVEYSNGMINPYDKNSGVNLGGIGDPNIMKHKTIDSTLSDSWKNCHLPQQLSEKTLTLAQELGYSFS